MAYIARAYVVMVYVVMAYIVMAYIVMARHLELDRGDDGLSFEVLAITT